MSSGASRFYTGSSPDSLCHGWIFVDRGDEGDEAVRAAGASAYVVKSRAALDLAEVVVAVARSTGNMSGSSAKPRPFGAAGALSGPMPRSARGAASVGPDESGFIGNVATVHP
jgi:hypothetical protein